MLPLLDRAAVLTLLCVVVLGGCASSGGAAPAPADPAAVRLAPGATGPTAQPTDQRPVVRAIGVLRRWDRLRASAYAAEDHRSLRRLYAPGSAAGLRDVRLLREYGAQGLVVRGLTFQRVEAELLAAPPGLLRLRVVERLAAGTVVGDDRSVTLPAGRFAARVVTLVRGQDGWSVRSVRRG